MFAKIIATIGIRGIVIVVGVLASLGAVGWFIHHQREIGRDAAIAQMRKETDVESERRRTVVAEALKVAEAASTKIQTMEEKNAELRQQIETLSARNDTVGCLDADAVERLRRLSEPDRR